MLGSAPISSKNFIISRLCNNEKERSEQVTRRDETRGDETRGDETRKTRQEKRTKPERRWRDAAVFVQTNRFD
jgi:hypothetical protein